MPKDAPSDPKTSTLNSESSQELSAVVRAHVDAFIQSGPKTNDAKRSDVPDAVFDLAGDVSNAIARSKGVQLDPVKAKGLVERVVKKEILARVDLPGPVMNVLQNVLFRTLPRLIGDGAAKWFKSMDADGDGRVSKEEFAKGAAASLCCCCSSCSGGQAAAEAFCGFLFPCASCCCGS